MLGDDRALLGDHVPIPVGPPADVDDSIVEVDLGSSRARAGRHRHRAAGGVRMTVIGGVGAEHDTVGIQQRVEIGDLGRPDQMTLRADTAQHPLDVMKPIRLVLVGRQAKRAAAVPAGRLSGLRLEPLVQLGAVVVDLGHVETGDEMRDQSGRVPRGAGRELALLHQGHVRPPLLGQVIEESDPHDAAADNDDTRVSLHRSSRKRGGRSCTFCARPADAAAGRRRAGSDLTCFAIFNTGTSLHHAFPNGVDEHSIQYCRVKIGSARRLL